MWISRTLKSDLDKTLARGKSILLFGPRQTGKTSLVQKLPHDRYINLMEAELAILYEREPGLLLAELRRAYKKTQKPSCIIIDEIQRLPNLTDTCQIAIDEGIAQFIITGSSARKIKNLLPGRVTRYSLSAINCMEYDFTEKGMEFILAHGTLPRILSLQDQAEINEDLESYVSLYLEEEIRKEALVRNLNQFSNFLRLACMESGNIVNLRAISQEIGVSHTTISGYYQILEDCLLVRKIEALTKTKNARRRLSRSPIYTLFDLGIRRLGARELSTPNQSHFGPLFEQFVAIELCKLIETRNRDTQLYYWRCHNGPEVDFVLEQQGQYIPIEVKLSKLPKQKDARHLKVFREEYPLKDHCYMVANVQHEIELEPGIIVIPWFKIHEILS